MSAQSAMFCFSVWVFALFLLSFGISLCLQEKVLFCGFEIMVFEEDEISQTVEAAAS